MRKGTLTVKLKFKVLPDGLSGQSVAGEPVFPASIAQGNTFEVDISPICDTRKAEVKYSLVSNSLESVTDTAKIYIPASLDAYNIAFKRKLVQSIIYCATERERVWATIDYEATRLFTGIVDLSNLTIQSYSYQGDIELVLKDNGYLLDEKIAQSIELPVQAFPRFSPASSPKTKGVYYKDPDNANAFYFWNGSAWAHKESFSDTESKYFHPDATVRVWSSAVVGGELVESVVGALLGMAGYSVSGGTIDPSASDTSTSVVRCFTYDMSEDKTYKEVLDTLLKEYRMCLTFTPEGKVRIVSLSHTSIHATRDIGYGLKGTLGRRDGIKTTFEASKKDGVKLKYSSGLAVRREQSIYSENLGSEFDENGELKGTAIKPQQCLPETGDITATYQEFNAKFLDRAYTTKVNRKENEDLSIISTHGHHLEVAQKGGTLTYPAFTVGESAEHGTGANPYFMPKKAQVLFRNDYEMKNKDPDSTEYEEEAESHSIYLQIFNIVADVLYRDKTTTIYAPSATANPETYESTYLFEDGPARTFANFYLGWNQYGAMKTDWTEYKGTVDTIGSIIGYQHTDSAISSYCLLSEETISFTGSPDVPFVIKMHGIGIAPYNDKPVQSVSYMGDNKNRGANGATGPKGETGASGTDGRGIASVAEYYMLSDQQTAPSVSDSAWNATPQTPTTTKPYLWKKTVVSYTSGSPTVSLSITGRSVAGWSQATLQLFKRSATAPAKYDGSTLTYTFSTATLAGNKGSWSITIPSGADPLYVIYAPAFGQGETDIVETSDWTVPAILSENGTRGENGDTVATVMLYQRSASTPSKPSGVVTYNFLSGAVSNTGSWSNTVPASDGNPLWVITAVASVTGSSNVHEDTIQPSEWSTPSIMAKDGKAMTYMYASAPEGLYPGGYPFGTDQNAIGMADTAIGINYEWHDTVPDIADGYVLWTKTVAPDGTVSIYRVQGPKGEPGETGPQGEKGEAGATGASVTGIVEEYALSTSSTSVTGTWGTAVPTLTPTNRYLWNRSKTQYSNGTASGYTTPVVIGVYGDKGDTGGTGATGRGISSITEYYLASASPTAPSASDTGWSTSAQTPTEAKPYLWNKTVVTYTSGSPTTTIAMIGQSIKGNPGATGATGRGISSIAHYYATTTTQSAPSANSITSTTIPAMSASKKYLWRKTVITYTDSTTSPSVELIAIYGDTGDSASIKDFDLDLSAKAFSVSPRGYTRTAQTIVATCTLIHVAVSTVTITWSSTSSQVTLTPSSDKTTCTISVAARVALLPFRVSCAVTGVGLTKTVSIDVQPETGNAYMPIYLGTNWDPSKSWSNNNDPIFSGDYYLDTSTNTPMIASVASNGTITYSAMQTGNPNTALIMGNVLSDILAQGSGVQSTCVAVNAYFGAIAAKTGFIKSLRSQVIQSSNYTYEGMDEGKPETDASWPVSGWELDGPNNVIKSVGLRSAGGEFHDVNITSGNITITDSDMNTILATVKDDTPSKLSGSVTADYYLVDEVVASSGMAENAETSIACRYDGASYPIAVRATREINYSFYYSNAYIDTTKEYESVTVVLNDTKKDVVIYAGHIKNSERRIELVQLFLTSPSGTITTLYHDRDGASGSKTFSVGTLPMGTSIEAIFGCYVVGQGGYSQGPLLEGMFTVTASGNTYSAGNLYLLDSSFNIAVTLPLSSYLSHTSHPLVVGSASSSAKYSMVSDFIATLSVGNFQIDQSKTMTYSDGIYGSITQLASVTVTNNSITMTRSGASPISYYSGGVIVGSPSLSVYAVSRLKGATVYNLNRAGENSLVGTAPKPFASVWTRNLNNVPVTDSSNQSLAVSGASSIVGAINQINRDLGSHLAPEIVTNAYGFGFRLGNVIINCLNGTTQNTWNQLWKLPIPYTSRDTYSVVGSCGYNTKRPAMIAHRVSADTVQAGMDQITEISLICIGY